VQMPPGVPVATVAINGARNAAILAAKILRIAGLADTAAGAAAGGAATSEPGAAAAPAAGPAPEGAPR